MLDIDYASKMNSENQSVLFGIEFEMPSDSLMK